MLGGVVTTHRTSCGFWSPPPLREIVSPPSYKQIAIIVRLSPLLLFSELSTTRGVEINTHMSQHT